MLTTSRQQFKITGTLAGGQTGLRIRVRQFAGTAIETWDAYGAAADRRWLEPLSWDHAHCGYLPGGPILLRVTLPARALFKGLRMTAFRRFDGTHCINENQTANDTGQSGNTERHRETGFAAH